MNPAISSKRQLGIDFMSTWYSLLCCALFRLSLMIGKGRRQEQLPSRFKAVLSLGSRKKCHYGTPLSVALGYGASALESGLFHPALIHPKQVAWHD